jgi:hypothetical protein
VATTAHTASRSSSVRGVDRRPHPGGSDAIPGRRRGSGRIRRSSSSQAEAFDEWAPPDSSTIGRRSSRSALPARHTARATASAERLAMEPPETNAAPGRRRQSGEVGEPPQRLVLGVHGPGALEPRAAVDARGGHDHVEQRGGFGGGARHERQVARVVDRQARRAEHVDEEAQRLLATEPLRGDGLPGRALRAARVRARGRAAAGPWPCARPCTRTPWPSAPGPRRRARAWRTSDGGGEVRTLPAQPSSRSS